MFVVIAADHAEHTETSLIDLFPETIFNVFLMGLGHDWAPGSGMLSFQNHGAGRRFLRQS